MRIFSMFTGVGGFEIGINKAFTTHSNEGSAENILSNKPNDNNAEWRRTPPVCVGFSEIDKYASELLKNKWPEVRNYGDATKINTEELPDFDVLVGGFPCQAFSMAGNRQGFNDTRGTLFFEIARIAEAKKPRLMVLENVKGLLSHDQGRTLGVIFETLYELGYEYQFGVVNSRYFGVPQNRERIIIVANLRGTSRPKVFPLGGEDEEDFGRVGQDVSVCLDASYYKGTDLTGLQKMKRQHVEVTALDLYNKKSHTDRTPALTEPHHNSLRMKVGTMVRRLTPVECERLQGFPDNWTAGFSDTQRYKMMGNAVTTNVIQAVFERILE